MQRNSKSSNDGRENKRNRTYWCSCKGHGKFTRWCRKHVRMGAKQALCESRDPLPKDPKSREYFD